jgi:alkylation response protein AidB-like acyl-CoA dehydrogenase
MAGMSAPSAPSPSTTPEARLRDGGAAAVLAAAGQVAEQLRSRAELHDRQGSYAPENIADVWRAGLGNLTIPAASGGVGADLRTTLAAVEVLAAGDPSTTLILVMHLLQQRLINDPRAAWPAHIRQRLVADSLAGPALVNTLRVEPELGTPARGGIPATRAVRRNAPDGGAHWRLAGHKIYSTGSTGLRWMLVWAATDAADPDGQRVGFFVVSAATPGIEIRETWDHLGMRASASHDVLFHDVIVPLDDVVNLQAPGRAQSGGGSIWSTGLLLAIYNGVARAGRDWLVRYLNERVPTNLGAPLASLPRFQTAVGEIETLLYTNDQLLHALAAEADRQAEADRLAEAGGQTEAGSQAGSAGGQAGSAGGRPAAPGLVKVVVTANAIKSLEIGLSLTGNPGLSHHHPLQRHYRDALCSRIHTPQDDVVLLGAGKAALGL